MPSQPILRSLIESTRRRNPHPASAILVVHCDLGGVNVPESRSPPQHCPLSNSQTRARVYCRGSFSPALPSLLDFEVKFLGFSDWGRGTVRNRECEWRLRHGYFWCAA